MITDDGTPGKVQSSPAKSRIAEATWPVAEEDVRAVVRVFATERDRTFMARPIGFSSSGMAFRAQENFDVGDVLSVSLSLPSRNESLKLPVEVMRIVERREKEERICGARFSGLDGRTLSRRQAFLAGG